MVTKIIKIGDKIIIANAYLDPGTGSLVTSIIIGAVATAIYIFKDFFYGLKNRKNKKNK